MPLQNRVAPNGDLHAVKARGTMLGNRGGKFHRDDQTLGKRRWASHHWIACELHYKNWHHEPMGQGYTSLFFLDEVTALSAGHRPCFMCRRKEAKAFLAGMAVDEFDRELHAERASRHRKADAPQHERALPHPEVRPLGSLEGPDGTMYQYDNSFFALRHRKLLHWSFDGYTKAVDFNAAVHLKLLTPPSILAILARGYQPRWHPSAEQWDN